MTEFILAYHGTEEEFATFDPSLLGQNTDADENRQAIAKLGFWFNEEESAVRNHYGKARAYYLNIVNPKEIDLTALFLMSPEEINKAAEEWQSEGHDGLKVKDTEFGGYSYVPFSIKQIYIAE